MDFCAAATLAARRDPDSFHTCAIVSFSHSLQGRPTLRTYCSVVGTNVPGMKQARLSGWSAGARRIFPKSWRRLFRRRSVAALCLALPSTVAFDTREIYAGATPTIFLKQRFWKPLSFRCWATVRIRLAIAYNNFDSTKLEKMRSFCFHVNEECVQVFAIESKSALAIATLRLIS